MPEPIDYQVIRNLQAALQGMAVVDGYHYDVAQLAVKLDPNNDVEALIAPGGPRPFVLLEVLGDTWQWKSKPDEILHTLLLRLHWVSESTPTADEDRLQVFCRGCADMERAINVDRSRGGLAFETMIRGRTFDTAGDDGSQVWAQMDVEASIYRTFGEPDS